MTVSGLVVGRTTSTVAPVTCACPITSTRCHFSSFFNHNKEQSQTLFNKLITCYMLIAHLTFFSYQAHKCVEKVSRSNCPVCLVNNCHSHTFMPFRLWVVNLSSLLGSWNPFFMAASPTFRRTSTPAESRLRFPHATTSFTRCVSWMLQHRKMLIRLFQTCFDDMLKSGHYACPVCGVRPVIYSLNLEVVVYSNIPADLSPWCSTHNFNINWFQLSMMDMSDVWKIYDREISETPMPSNTCNLTSESHMNMHFQGNIKIWPVLSNAEIAWKKALESSTS